MDSPEQQKYWSVNDKSYTEVSNPSLATKVSFGGPCWGFDAFGNWGDLCDHSAITTYKNNVFISK